MSSFYTDDQWGWLGLQKEESNSKNYEEILNQNSKQKEDLYFQESSQQVKIQRRKIIVKPIQQQLINREEMAQQKKQRQKSIKKEASQNLKRLKPLKKPIVDQKNKKQAEREQMQQQSDETQKQNKQGRQSLYSKVYREKKKQKFKILEEQNKFLKNKIDQLQLRLREKQHQLNKLKYDKILPQISIEQLNTELLQKVKIMLDEVDRNENENQLATSITQNELNASDRIQVQDNILKSRTQDQIYKSFFETYDCHGFGGKKKLEILNYYITELLENVLKDSQKYYYICMIKKQGWLHMSKEGTNAEPNIIDFSVSDIMGDLSEAQQKKMLLYENSLKPMFVKLKNSCSQLYQSYVKMINALDNTQNFVKKAYNMNFQFAIKRMKIQNWFLHNQYTKQMRRIRNQWIEMIKNNQENACQQLQPMAGKKKRSKTPHKEVV